MRAQPTTDLQAAKGDLDELGYCLIQDALSPGEVEDYSARLDRLVNGGGGKMNLIGADEKFLDLAQHPLALELADYQLGPEFLLSGSNAIIQRPGASAQNLHSDQAYAPPPWPHPLTMNIIWMLDEFTAANGATRLIPGSHRWNVSTERGVRNYQDWFENPVFLLENGERVADSAVSPIPVEGPAGTALVMDGRMWHQAGPNSTSDQRRRGAQTYFCRPHMRQQTCFYLSLPRPLLERAQQSPLLKRLLGYQIYYNVIGVIDPPPGEPP
jgi:ectoine hydroxylase-related dioxygenase (phytanoyl-CoA dioxygenase family)